jgi:hypothetical protein
VLTGTAVRQRVEVLLEQLAELEEDLDTLGDRCVRPRREGLAGTGDRILDFVLGAAGVIAWTSPVLGLKTSMYLSVFDSSHSPPAKYFSFLGVLMFFPPEKLLFVSPMDWRGFLRSFEKWSGVILDLDSWLHGSGCLIVPFIVMDPANAFTNIQRGGKTTLRFFNSPLVNSSIIMSAAAHPIG